jgi:hypothetical protein
MQGRRSVLLGLGALGLLGAAGGPARARVRNGRPTPYGNSIVAELGLADLTRSQAYQACPMWCWAATMEMLFRAYGYDLPQQKLVLDEFGSETCQGASPEMVVSVSNRDYTDDGGHDFRVKTVASYSHWDSSQSLNNIDIINALASDQPLIYCNRTHMMLCTAIEYVPTPGPPRVLALGFLDPWPTPTSGTMPGPIAGTRGATPKEMLPRELGGDLTYIGRVIVTALD